MLYAKEKGRSKPFHCITHIYIAREEVGGHSAVTNFWHNAMIRSAWSTFLCYSHQDWFNVNQSVHHFCQQMASNDKH
jgi:hypothetical protein